MSEYVQLPERSLLGKKIVLCGLSEAGKTSIRDVVFGGKTATEVEGYGATLNYVRQFISLEGGQFTLLDLGGQRIFLDRFITKFSPFVFHNVAALIYVVDIAENDRFNSAKHYFDAAFVRLMKYSPKSHVFVLIHKMDLIEKDPNKEYITEHLRSLFYKDIDYKILFFETTIYNETIKDALYEILRISFPDIYAKTLQPPQEMPSAVAQQDTVSTAADLSIEAPQPVETPQQQADIEAALSPPTKIPQRPTVKVNISEIAKAFSFIENPTRRNQIKELLVKEAKPIPSPPVIAEEVTEGKERIEPALQFVEAETQVTEESPSIQEPLIEVHERPELPTEELRDLSEEFGSIEIDINTLLTEDEIEELLPPLEDSITPQIAPEDVILPATAFETHPSLDEEFDEFAAAEEVVKFLEVTKDLFKLSYIAIKLNDGENLVYVGDLEKYDELVSTALEIFQLQTESDPIQTSRFVMRAKTIFILIEPTEEGLSMVLIGPSISKFPLLSKMSEFKARITKMINMTFYDML